MMKDQPGWIGPANWSDSSRESGEDLRPLSEKELSRGSDADLVLFDSSEIQVIHQKTLHSGAPYTLYEGKKCLGRPILTMQRGKILVEQGEMKGKPGKGRFLPTKITS
jgi:dihydropyrimidinase